MRVAMIVLAAALGATVTPHQASAYGALAVGVPANVARDGFASGITVDRPTEADARESALRTCRGQDPNARVQSQASGPAQKLCTLVTTFHRQCAVVAQDPAAGTPGIGWAVAPTLAEATQQALDNCRATAGATRKQYCVRDGYNCDTK